MPPDRLALRSLTARHGLPPGRRIAVRSAAADLRDWVPGGAPPAGTAGLAGRSVLVQTGGQLATVRAMLALDGVARRMVLAPPGLPPQHMGGVVAAAGIDALVTDDPASRPGLEVISASAIPAAAPGHATDTEWVLFTSGTTGAPKLVTHSLAALTGPVGAPNAAAVWSTFYDVRRYGGLQILLRALLGGGSMVLSDPAEAVGDFLARAGAEGVTHISGTPSHWRRVLISGQARRMDPAYVRLSGEIADQPLLDQLRGAYPRAQVAHAFASTEAGVAFDVTDGQAGFPAAWVGDPGRPVELSVAGGTLRIRSGRIAGGYLGDVPPLAGQDGFVDTGDRVELRDGRYHFLGRAGGVINVGGQKVHPEEIEAVLHQHPAVLAARVRPRANPITGAIVSAEVVAAPDADPGTLRQALLALCRAQLAPHKVPALLRMVPSLDVLPSGKLARTGP